MNLIEKLEPVILILAIIVGLILSDIEILSKNSGNLINLFLCIMVQLISMYNDLWVVFRSSSQRFKKKL